MFLLSLSDYVVSAIDVVGRVRVEVIFAYDPNLPAPTPSEEKQMLEEAKLLLKRKLKGDIDFVGQKRTTVESLFKDFKQKIKPLSPQDCPFGDFEQWFSKIVASDRDGFINDIEERIPWEDLRTFLKNPEHVQNYDDAGDHIISVYKETLKQIVSSENNSIQYLNKNVDKCAYTLFGTWLKLSERHMVWSEQKKNVFVITNEIIIDNGLGGLHTMAHRGIIAGNIYFLSVFPFYSGVELLEEKAGRLTKEEKPKIAGALLAHELGHFIFHVGDHYEEDSVGCLMNRRGTLLQEKEWYYSLLKTPCDKDILWIQFDREFNDIMKRSEKQRMNLEKEVAQFIQRHQHLGPIQETVIARLLWDGKHPLALKLIDLYKEELLKKLKESNKVGKGFHALIWICLVHKSWGSPEKANELLNVLEGLNLSERHKRALQKLKEEMKSM